MRYKRLFLFVLTTIIVFLNINVYGEETLRENELNARAAVLIDGNNGRVLYGKNIYEKLPMASTTKIMTCLIALEYGNLQDTVTFSEYAASMPKVKLGVAAGTKFMLQDMLYSMMLESHNDTAVAIAEHIAGNVHEFSKLMNQRAQKIGAFDTRFVTPNGLDADEHYSTAYDMAIIAAEAMKNETFCQIIKTREYQFKDVEQKNSYNVYNKDSFLEMMEGAVGVKTGFTGKAGYCFVGAVKKNDKFFVSVVLASGWPPNKNYKWKDTIRLMKYGDSNYENKSVFSGDREYKKIKVKKGQKKFVSTYIEGNKELLLSDSDRVDYKYEIDKNVLTAPVEKGKVVGRMYLYVNDVLMESFEIKTKSNVKKADIKYYLKKHFGGWL